MIKFGNADWKSILSDSLESPDTIAAALDLDPGLLRQVTDRYPARINPYYLDLIRKEGAPLFRQAVPDPEELQAVPGLLADPLYEEKQSPAKGLFHRYPDRVILAITGGCALFCRHCMRKRRICKEDGFDRESAMAYLRKTPEVRDVILSGGDPLLLADGALEDLLSEIHAIGHVETIRIHTRMPCTLPQRITKDFVAMLQQFAPLYVNTHFNHPAELTPEAAMACGRLVDGGIPVGCQSVLLRGVNDEISVLTALFRGLLRLRVKPYYLHHPDPVAGTAGFRMDLSRGLALYRGIRGHVSGMAVPPYMIDLPGGGGKVSLSCHMDLPVNASGWMPVTNFEGKQFWYPARAVPSGPQPRQGV